MKPPPPSDELEELVRVLEVVCREQSARLTGLSYEASELWRIRASQAERIAALEAEVARLSGPPDGADQAGSREPVDLAEPENEELSLPVSEHEGDLERTRVAGFQHQEERRLDALATDLRRVRTERAGLEDAMTRLERLAEAARSGAGGYDDVGSERHQVTP